LRLLAAARAHRERDWLMILVAFWHGLRASEVTRFTADAVRDGHLIIQRLKGSLKTVQPLVEHPDPLLNERAALIDFASKSKLNQSVFRVSRSQSWRLVQKYAKAAGIRKHKAHPHVLKHSIAMQTIGSAGIENVRQYLGHKSIASTGAYLRVTDADASSAVTSAAGGRERSADCKGLRRATFLVIKQNAVFVQLTVAELIFLRSFQSCCCPSSCSRARRKPYLMGGLKRRCREVERDREPAGLRVCGCPSPGHWPETRKSAGRRFEIQKIQWLRFRVECCLGDRAEGKPAQATILADNRESVREVELGAVPLPAAKPVTSRKPN
jgi:type 1 fimbriae regulatory protein FimB